MKKLIFICFALISNFASGANLYWTGAISNNWSLAANWSFSSGGIGGATVPTSADDVFFDSGGLANCVIDINASCRTLTVAPSYLNVIAQLGSLTIGTSAANGNSSWSGGTFIGGNTTIVNYGTFTLAGTAFTSTNSTLSVGKDYSFTSGSFSHNNGTVSFDQSLSHVPINVSNSIPLTFNHVIATAYYATTTFSNSPAINGNLTLNGAAASQTVLFSSPIIINGNLVIVTSAGGNQTINFSSAPISATVNGNLSVTGAGALLLNTGVINAKGDISYNNTSNTAGGSGTLNISGSGIQTLTGSGNFNQGNLPKVTINSMGALNLMSYITCTNGWRYNSGTINPGTSTVCFYNTGADFPVSGTHTLNDVVFYGSFSQFIIDNDFTANNLTFDSNTSGFTATINSSITANGNFTMKGASTMFSNIGTLNLKGNILNTNSSLFSGGSGTININGPGNQTIAGTSGIDQGAYPFFKIDKPSGTVSFSGYLTFTRGFTWIKGTVDPGISTCAFNNTAASPQSISADATGMSFYDITFEQPDYLRTRLNTNINVLGSFKIAAGSGIQTNNHDISIAGDFISLNTTAVGGNYAITGNGSVGNGTVIFNGTGPQIITTNNPSSSPNLAIFYNVVINNSAARSTNDDISLADRLTITNSITFSNGRMLATPVQNLYLKTSASTNTGNSSSYVNGPMSHEVGFIGTRNLNFPIGDGGNWRNVVLRLSHGAGTSYTYTVQTIHSSAVALGYALPTTINNVSDVRYTTINRVRTSTGLASSADLTGIQQITVRYGSDDYVTDYLNLVVAKTTSTGSPWVDIGGNATANATGTITATFLSAAFTSSDKFCLANTSGGSNPLPIKLVSFEAKKEENKILLTWETASEINNDHFEVTRSMDGKEWEFLKLIKAVGNSHEHHYYSTEDENPIQGPAYYRLTQVDFEGKTESFIVFVRMSSSFNSLYPNPAIDQIVVEAEDLNIDDIRVLNQMGMEMTPFVKITRLVQSKVVIDISNLPPQAYILRAKNVSGIIFKQ